MKRVLVVAASGFVLLVCGTVMGQADKHPHLTNATNDLNNAAGEITAAQEFHAYHIDGKAASAQASITAALRDIADARQFLDSQPPAHH